MLSRRIIVTLLFLAPVVALAYSETPTVGDWRAEVFPSNPEPNQEVTIQLASYLVNMDACNIHWAKDSKPASGGIGEKTFSFQTAPLGKTVGVSVAIYCDGQDPWQKSFVFQSNDVDLLAEADSYTPPFYRGGAKVTAGTQVRIIAIPQVFNASGSQVDASTLIYRWSKDGKTMTTSSGYGKNTVVIPAPDVSGQNLVKVEISSLAGDLLATKSILVRQDYPSVLLYENKPLLGIQWQKTAGASLTLPSGEITLVAEPYFFSNSSLANNQTSFNWQMNDKEFTPGNDPRTILLRQLENQSGQAKISVQVQDQIARSSAQNSLVINFGPKAIGF